MKASKSIRTITALACLMASGLACAQIGGAFVYSQEAPYFQGTPLQLKLMDTQKNGMGMDSRVQGITSPNLAMKRISTACPGGMKGGLVMDYDPAINTYVKNDALTTCEEDFGDYTAVSYRLGYISKLNSMFIFWTTYQTTVNVYEVRAQGYVSKLTGKPVPGGSGVIKSLTLVQNGASCDSSIGFADSQACALQRFKQSNPNYIATYPGISTAPPLYENSLTGEHDISRPN